MRRSCKPLCIALSILLLCAIAAAISLNSERTRIHALLIKGTEENNALSASLAQAQGQAASLADSLEDAQARITEAEASLAEANAQLESVTQEAGALRARLDASLFSAETEEDRQQIVDTLNRGFYARAKLAIQGGDASGLENCFSDSFLRTDPSITLSLAGDAPFHAYSIASFTHELTVGSVCLWPEARIAACTVEEHVPAIQAASALPEGASLPAFNGGIYDVTLEKTDGHWEIVDISQAAILIEGTP